MLTRHTTTDFRDATQWVVERLQALKPGPFERPVVLAEHPAQWRAITIGVAQEAGCFASVRLLTPTGWVDETLKLEGEHREWRPRAMSWRLVEAIATRVAEMPPAAKRIVEANDGVALHEFARQVAERFWDYLRYRPELPLSWEDGDALQSDDHANEQWQRVLWQELCARTGTVSPAQRIATIRREGVTLGADVPAAVILVEPRRLAPTVRELLERIAEQRDVHCCALAAVAERPAAQTVSLHACHSPLREIETLRELAVEALHNDPTLKPEDITLYVSDIATYAPAVEAVFDVPEDGMPQLPYSIAGRPFRDASAVVRTVLQLVDVADGRGSLDEIGSLLRLEPVARAAGFTEDEANAALRMATQAGITWGEDAAARALRHGVPEIAAGTWQHGVERLVLGVATGPTMHPVDDVLPVAGDTGGNVELIGRLAAWSADVFDLCAAMRNANDASAWTQILERILRDFVHIGSADDAEAARSVRAALQDQLEAVAESTTHMPLSLATLRSMLERALSDRGARMGHLRGGLRVCRLEPGTVLPARVVLLAGFDDTLHPGGGGSLAWDLLFATPSVKQVGQAAADARRAQDPDRRAAMVEVFNEAIASATDAVHVAWTGFTLTKEDVRAASVAVTQLRDQMQLTVQKEPAHPFSPKLFRGKGEHLHSAAAGWARAAQAIDAGGEQHTRFGEQSVPAAALTHIALDQLSACVQDPTRYFCSRVLGLQLYDNDDALADQEPMGIAPLTKKGVSQDFRVLSWRVESAAAEQSFASEETLAEWLRHQPELAYGAEGKRIATTLAAKWWPSVDAWRALTPIPVRPFTLDVGGYQLSGRLDRLTAGARVIPSLYDLSEYSVVKHWAAHLVLNVLAETEEGLPRETQFKTPSPFGFNALPGDEAREALLDLCQLFDEAHAKPLPLFRRAGVALIEGLELGEPSAAGEYELAFSLSKARKAWYGDYNTADSAESRDEWHRLCWGERDFVNDKGIEREFLALAERVLLPMMNASNKQRKAKR